MSRSNGKDLSWRAVLAQALAVVAFPFYFMGTKVAEHNIVLGGLLFCPLMGWTFIVSIALFGKDGADG